MVVEGISQIPVIIAMMAIWQLLVMRFAAKNTTATIMKEVTPARSLRGPDHHHRWGWGVIAGKNAGYTLEGKQQVLYPFCASIPWVMTFVHGGAYFFLVVLIKRFFIGPFQEGAVQTEWDVFRRWLLERLVTSESFNAFMELWVNTE